MTDRERMILKQVKADSGGSGVEPPKQNTGIIRVNRPLVSDYQDLQADWVVRIMQMSSPAKITCKFMELFTSPMMPANETDKLFKSIDKDGWVTVEGNLVDAEYEKLFGKKWWPSIKEKNIKLHHIWHMIILSQKMKKVCIQNINFTSLKDLRSNLI